MGQEIPAFVFKFNADGLPAFGLDLAQGLAIRKARLQPCHGKALLAGHGAKEKEHPGFVRRGIGERRGKHRRAIDRLVRHDSGFGADEVLA